MPEKLLVQFLERWIRDAEFRGKVLHKELTTLGAEKYTADQIQALLSLDRETILAQIVKEFEGLGMDLDKAKKEAGRPQRIMAGSGYAEGDVHVRGVTPATIARGDTRHVVVRGQGFQWDSPVGNIQVQFVLGDVANPTATETYPAIDLGNDVDIYQRVTVEATLNQVGIWKVFARNVPSSGDNSGWSTETVTVTVTEP